MMTLLTTKKSEGCVGEQVILLTSPKEARRPVGQAMFVRERNYLMQVLAITPIIRDSDNKFPKEVFQQPSTSYHALPAYGL